MVWMIENRKMQWVMVNEEMVVYSASSYGSEIRRWASQNRERVPWFFSVWIEREKGEEVFYEFSLCFGFCMKEDRELEGRRVSPVFFQLGFSSCASRIRTMMKSGEEEDGGSEKSRCLVKYWCVLKVRWARRDCRVYRLNSDLRLAFGGRLNNR